MKSKPQPGSKPADYQTDYDKALSKEKGRVELWRKRITKAFDDLRLTARLEEVRVCDAYLDGTVEVKGQMLYLNYAMPTMEEVFRRTLPSMPSPSIEARSDAAEAPVPLPQQPQDAMMGLPPQTTTLGDVCRELVDLWFNSDHVDVKAAAKALQWDDARSGIGIGKVILETEMEPTPPRIVEDLNVAGVHIEKAQAENANIMSAVVDNDDAHYLHLGAHLEQYDMLRAYSASAMGMTIENPEMNLLWEHIVDHKSRTLNVTREGPRLIRVPWQRFVYDTSDEWTARGWEAELECIRVQELIDMGCRNVNKDNCPPCAEDVELAYEDKRCWVWNVHDRRNNRQVMVSADGPSNGLFLLDRPWPWASTDIYLPIRFRDWRPEQVEGQATLQMMRPILDELANVDFAIKRHRETHSSYKQGLPSGTDAKIKSQLNNPDARFFEVTREMGAAGRWEYKPPPIPETLLADRERLLGELRRVAGGIDAQDAGTPNPHTVSATESQNRAISREDKKETRQEVMGDFLAMVAKTMLVLFRRKGTTKQMVRVLGPAGHAFIGLDPASVPEDIDLYFDVTGQSEAGRSAQVEAWQIFIQTAPALGVMLDGQKTLEAMGRRLGIRHPENYTAPVPVGMPMAGAAPQPGMSNMGGPEPPATDGNRTPFGPQPQPAGSQLKIA